MEQVSDVTALASPRFLAGSVRRRPHEQPVTEDSGRDGAATIVVVVAAMAFEADVEQTGPVRGGPVADDPDVEQFLRVLVALPALVLAPFACWPAGDVCALDDEVAEPGRPRAVDRGE
ncbi:hypothetical protein [Micromonospora sp. NPDC006431]|uniref:hypothetical protein n=1 Tax=Micromonospora sp. NPDC006431 TaxID=3364235 RepID=UPI0036974A5A